ncbi:stalk domain-containing protein [Paenibacillus abyssi]|uniref:Copper amine oxidase n=1 Tax=Paenibacillus abyssi TaxID=1340531 RepID=A0A917LGC0_9BACL|nr:stalk domain-containing protein [Paenibacillus abyssi]GGG21794.1 hypothetical protein GCM10010916_43120 [Paenibacillus abyssi]
MNSKLRKTAPKAAALFLTAALVTASLPAAAANPFLPRAAAAVQTAQAEAGQHGTFRIVGIGDSITAGYEYGAAVDTVPYGYVERVFEQALFRGRAEYANYGILGLKVEGLQQWLAAAEQNDSITASEAQEGLNNYLFAEQTIAKTAQLRSDLQQADLVVMTIGGNNFSGLFEQLSGGRAASDAWLVAALEQYDVGLTASIRSIAALNPNARIVISDLYSPVPDHKVTLGVLGITQDDRTYLLEAARMLRERLQAIVARFKQEGVRIDGAYSAELFEGKERQYTTIGLGDLHPTQNGYSVMGDAFAEAIWGDVRTVAPRPKDVGISVVVDGKEIINDNKPVLRANRTYLAFRDIADAMGATTKWDNKTKTVTITYGSNEVALTIGASAMRVNGNPIAIDTPAFLHKAGKEQKTYVPLAVLADGLGFQVEYRGKLKTAFINK